MKLSQLISQAKTDFKISCPSSDIDSIEVDDIAIDSRLVKKNSIFFALKGKENDGAKFIADAINKGAAVIVTSSEIYQKNVTTLHSFNPSQLLTEFLKIFYSPLPANIYAITGTNGKTSVAEFTRQILQFLGKKSASIGTLGVMCGSALDKDLCSSSLTTPDIISLYKNLSILKKNGIDDVALEVSSIGLEQGRVAGLKIAAGAFTNFTQDHLDYHQSMEEYFKCKMILFASALDNGSFAVVNSDIEKFSEIKKICERKNLNLIEYGFNAWDLRLQKIEQLAVGQKIYFEFRQKNYEFTLSVSGEFQAFNTLCALGNLLAKNNLSDTQLANLLQNFHLLQTAQGRMQHAGTTPNGAQIFIDFAHTSDALKNVLKLARNITKNRVIILFGCGGDRDAKKRPTMGRIACDLADLAIITDDNPRRESAEVIRAEIISGCDVAKTLEIPGRKEAIEKAVAMLESGDILILAGKGHENYQIIGDQKFEFNEEKIAQNALSKLS